MTQQREWTPVLLSDDVKRAVGLRPNGNVSLLLQTEGERIAVVELTPLAAEVVAEDLTRIAALSRRQ